MKRRGLKLITAALLLVFILCGCSAKEQTKTMRLEQDNISVEMVFEAKGDIIHTIIQTTEMSLEGVDEETVKQLKQNVESMKTTYAQYEGVTYTSEVGKENFKETITIDTSSEETIKELSENELLPIDGETSKLSLKKTMESLTESGWTEQ